MKACHLKCHFVMQEKYGLGEPSDEMMNKILLTVQGKDFERVIRCVSETGILFCKTSSDMSRVCTQVELGSFRYSLMKTFHR